MPKNPLPLHAYDLTTFVRALSNQLGDESPKHLSLMNMVARAAGFQNVQHMRSAHAAAQRLKQLADAPPADARVVERALHQFDSWGRLRQWPSRRNVQTLALWALWARLPADQSLSEREVNENLNEEHVFADPATLRRTMVSCGLLSRRNDGTNYRRIEQKPTAEAKALIRELGVRRQARPQDALEGNHA